MEYLFEILPALGGNIFFNFTHQFVMMVQFNSLALSLKVILIAGFEPWYKNVAFYVLWKPAFKNVYDKWSHDWQNIVFILSACLLINFKLLYNLSHES